MRNKSSECLDQIELGFDSISLNCLKNMKTVYQDENNVVPSESFQLQMRLSFPFLRANDLRSSLLNMRTHSLLYIGLFLNLIANVVNNNDQHVRSGINVRMSQNPHRRRKRMGSGIIIARRTTIIYVLLADIPDVIPCHFVFCGPFFGPGSQSCYQHLS